MSSSVGAVAGPLVISTRRTIIIQLFWQISVGQKSSALAKQSPTLTQQLVVLFWVHSAFWGPRKGCCFFDSLCLAARPMVSAGTRKPDDDGAGPAKKPKVRGDRRPRPIELSLCKHVFETTKVSDC